METIFPKVYFIFYSEMEKNIEIDSLVRPARILLRNCRENIVYVFFNVFWSSINHVKGLIEVYHFSFYQGKCT